ncbi:hypothetical protein B7C42_04531 [Nocardia cerradoensis]|uniref:Uncharacterized protein n=1 Tax=Nocardia cerradoensis TaxID=85688 RepID=A0A231H411_9NOCA|nr:hypothetical protein [Nocardia cerradoensis]OXR43663.1 hypothetical protein B7C42_04531 [Nocardia cerradoensis]
MIAASPRRACLTLRGLRIERPQHRLIILAACVSHTVQWPIYRFWDFQHRRFRLRPCAERISATGP